MASKMNTSNTKAGVQYNIYFVGWKGLFWELHVFMVARNNYHNLNNRTKKYVVQNHPIQLVDNHTLIWLYYINSLMGKYMKNHLGMIPRILPIIPVTSGREVMIKFVQIYAMILPL